MSAYNGQNAWQALGLAALTNLQASSQFGAYQGLAQQQAAACHPSYMASGFANLSAQTRIFSDGDYWETREQRQLAKAQKLAAEVRARHPEMQVIRRTKRGDE